MSWNEYYAEMDRIRTYDIHTNHKPEGFKFGTANEASDKLQQMHLDNINAYHEVWATYIEDTEFFTKGFCTGIEQYKPGDCPVCRHPMYPTHNIADERVWVCDHCNSEFPFVLVGAEQ